MIKIYVDAAYDLKHNIGCYCVVRVDEDTTKSWDIFRVDDVGSSIEAETAGIRRALNIGAPLRRAGFAIAVYCDSVSSLQQCRAEAQSLGILLRHVKAHQLWSRGVEVTENRKCQHWADVQANTYLKNVLDILSTSEQNVLVGKEDH